VGVWACGRVCVCACVRECVCVFWALLSALAYDYLPAQ
jgi:hypothetical protein